MHGLAPDVFENLSLGTIKIYVEKMNNLRKSAKQQIDKMNANIKSGSK